MFFDGEVQNSSKKITCPPGGNSNFQFLHPDPKPDACNFKKFPDSRSNYNIVNLESKENAVYQDNVQRNCSVKTGYEFGKEKCNIFHNQFPEQAKQPSIKVTQMPGGNSHVRYAPYQ